MSPRLIKPLSLFLGVVMFLFGILKFFQPFHTMFDTQIQQSHLPHQAVLAGKVSEMLTGVLFLLPWLTGSLTTTQAPIRGSVRGSVRRSVRRAQLLLAACLLLFSQMIVAIYVHLQPQVPAAVLPLGIKTPVIPGIVLLLGLLTAVAVWKELRALTASEAPSPTH